MSGKQNRNDELEPQGAAFEYVAGTLRGAERRRFERRLAGDQTLQAQVQFWQEQLMELAPEQQRAPAADTWDAICTGINTDADTTSAAKPGFGWAWFVQWAAPTFAAVALMLVLFGYYPSVEKTTPNTDYVAVLTDASGKAMLTALSAREGKKMWLKWDLEAFTPDTSAQLWAVSRRDGEVRPITVLDDTQAVAIDLSEATWRLISDAAFLLLTEEEPGGSAIDEPSEMLLAKGVCVRFSPPQKAI